MKGDERNNLISRLCAMSHLIGIMKLLKLPFNFTPKILLEWDENIDCLNYKWNLIDVATRTRFTAYTNELSSAYGYMFIVFCEWQNTWNLANPYFHNAMTV